MSAHALQPSTLPPCRSNPSRMADGGMGCYSDVTGKGRVAQCGASMSQWPLLTTVSYISEASRPRRRKPEETSRQGVPAQTCPRPIGIHSKRRVALPGLDHSVGSPRTRRSRTTRQGPRHSSRPSDGHSMAEHRRRMPSEFTPARLNEQGASPIALSLIRETS